MRSDDHQNIIQQFQQVLRDGLHYLESLLALLQARLTEYALSAIVFFILLAFSSLLIIAGFVTFNIALGVWLARTLENPTMSLCILGGFYFLLAIGVGWRAIRWLSKMKS